MKVKVFVCPKCGTGVYLRAEGDFRSCNCYAMAVGGTPTQPKISTAAALAPRIEIADLNLKTTEAELMEDWSNMGEEFGIIKAGDKSIAKRRKMTSSEMTDYLPAATDTSKPAPTDEEMEGDID